MKEQFRRYSELAAQAVGSIWAFLLALVTIAAWAGSGSYFGYSGNWQLVMNAVTSITTFLLVFIIQNTQNRQSRIMALKLDELLRGVEGARTGLILLDKLSDDELTHVQSEFSRLRDTYAPLVDDDLAVIEQEMEIRRHKRTS